MICLTDRISKNLAYHLWRDIPLNQSIFRHGSDAYGALLREARQLYKSGLLNDLDEDDLFLLESDAGELTEYDGKIVMLDTPERNWDVPGVYYVYSRKNSAVEKLTIIAEV